MTVAELKARAGDGDAVRVRGWVRTNRRGGRTGFITLSDGSCFSGCQIVYDAQEGGEQSAAARFHTGCAIEAEGVFTLTPGARQPFEVRARSVELVGGCDGDYPMQKKRHTLEFLREWPHLRVRTNTFQAMFRMRSILCAAIHEYFQNNGFIYVTTPIITGSDAEGAGEVFGVSGGDGGDFFGERAFLTVSGQLHAEPFALAFDKVYTFGPTFRAENSNTTVHASEFWMVEPEMAFCDLEDDMAVMEDMVKHCIRAVLKRAGEEVGFFSEFYGGGVPLADRLSSAAERAFARLTYTESIELLKKSGREFRFPVEWGADLKTEHERYLCETAAGGPVFITDYPKDIKAFYMRQNDDGKTVAACDLLMPGVGELIGGSQREERYDMLRRRLGEAGSPSGALSWYMDLRRFGAAPHAGFGAGIERFLLYLTGVGNIRDVIPYPRTPGNMIF